MIIFSSCKKGNIDVQAIDAGKGTDYTEQIDSSEPSVPDSTVHTSTVPSAIANYEYSWTGSDNIPPIVIIIDDFGNTNDRLLEDFGKLPSEICFAILPDLPHTKDAARVATENSHDIVIHVPMKAIGNAGSPGKRYIKVGMDKAEIKDMIASFKSQIPMAIGANNHMGSEVTQDAATMNNILESLNSSNLFFVDSYTIGTSVGFKLAKSKGYSSGKRDIFLDVPDNSNATLASKIEGLAKYKGRKEPVFIISHCHNRQKLEALQNFITQVQSMGIRIISLSDAINDYPA
jgi:hypothetical protein